MLVNIYYWAAWLIGLQEGEGFLVDDEDEDEEERGPRRKKKKRKNRDRSDEALDEEDLDLIGADYEPRDASQVGALISYARR